MLEIIVTVTLEVAKCLAQCLAPSAGRQIGYLRKHKSNFKSLKTEVEKLKDKRTIIQHDVDEAKRNGEEIEENVQKWLEKARKIIGEDVAKFGEDEEIAAKMRCCKGLCPDLKARYHLSTEAVRQLEDVVKHLVAGNFDRISYRTTPKDPRLCNKDYEAFQSRKPALMSVISSLTNPDVNIVGIYGMGGIGKTMLAKEIAKQLDINKLFDSVIFVEIRQNPDKMKIQREIQKEIAGRLGLRLSQEETGPVIAANLYRRLKAEKKILIILDNIWDHLDLQAVGIPLADEHKGCKVLLTARSVDVLAVKMDSQENFAVDFLDDEEAWRLFKKITGDYIEGGEFKSIATEVVNKCARLPLLL
ncbi:Disease resistance protein [Melia azedarach]|uniref:Disease resistance protein n=1 Tax=Melia azedarach TaxID=155640 RepID=A0ACC1YE73_MELAZ|nr:Disease resistance protein [Melia azedarach]